MIQEMRRFTDREYGEGKVSLSRYLLDVWIPEVRLIDIRICLPGLFLTEIVINNFKSVTSNQSPMSNCQHVSCLLITGYYLCHSTCEKD